MDELTGGDLCSAVCSMPIAKGPVPIKSRVYIAFPYRNPGMEYMDPFQPHQSHESCLGLRLKNPSRMRGPPRRRQGEFRSSRRVAVIGFLCDALVGLSHQRVKGLAFP